MLVFGKNQTRYQPTDEDVLWLSRAVEAEGPPRADVARALVNLFAFQRAHGGTRTLTDVVRAYAQPVNPRWFPNGDLLQKNGPVSSEELQRALNRQNVHSKRTSFSPETQLAVNEALTTPFSSDVTDYAVPTIDESRKGYEERSEPQRGLNRLWTRAPGWAGYSVDKAALTGGLLALLAIAFIAVAIGKHHA